MSDFHSHCFCQVIWIPATPGSSNGTNDRRHEQCCVCGDRQLSPVKGKLDTVAKSCTLQEGI